MDFNPNVIWKLCFHNWDSYSQKSDTEQQFYPLKPFWQNVGQNILTIDAKNMFLKKAINLKS